MMLGMWKRGWLAVDWPLLLVAVLPVRPSVLSPQRLGRVLAAGGLVAAGVLLPLAVAVQPAFDFRRDLLSDLAARGAALSAFGVGVLAAIGLAHLGAALLLATRRTRVGAAAAAVGGVCLLGVAAVPITCPRGAHGCSSADSGRAVPRPATDVLHRDLVAMFEVAAVVMLVAVALHLLRQAHRARPAAAALTLAALSPLLLAGQQRGIDIGYWQVGWIITVALDVVVVLLPGDGLRSGPGAPALTWAADNESAGDLGDCAGPAFLTMIRCRR